MNLALVCGEPTKRPLLPFAQAHPVLDARVLEGVEQVLAFECQVRPAGAYKGGRRGILGSVLRIEERLM